MKLIKKNSIIIICTFIISISWQNYGSCSDNAAVVEQTTQSQQVTNVNPVIPSTPPTVPTTLPTTPQAGSATKAGQGFIPVFVNMLKSLFTVVMLILALTGIVILYIRIKSKSASETREQQKETPSEDQDMEPSNVSEAVSSFVRHKIKRNP